MLLAMTVGVLLVITVSHNDSEGGLEASVDYGSVEGAFDVVDDSVGGEEGFHVEGLEVVVGDCEDDAGSSLTMSMPYSCLTWAASAQGSYIVMLSVYS